MEIHLDYDGDMYSGSNTSTRVCVHVCCSGMTWMMWNQDGFIWRWSGCREFQIRPDLNRWTLNRVSPTLSPDDKMHPALENDTSLFNCLSLRGLDFALPVSAVVCEQSRAGCSHPLHVYRASPWSACESFPLLLLFLNILLNMGSKTVPCLLHIRYCLF